MVDDRASDSKLSSMRKIFHALPLVVALVVFGAPVFASPDEDIPVESWIYGAVSELAAGQAGPRQLLHTVPYTRAQVADYLAELLPDTARLDPGRRILFRRLWDEFHEEITPNQMSDPKELALRAGGSPYLLSRQTEDRTPTNHAGSYVFAALGKPDRWVARTRVRFDSDARDDTRFRGREWKDKLTANMDDASLKFLAGNFEAFWGRGWLKFGRSPSDGLLMSGFSPPFDYGRLRYHRGAFDFMYFIAFLDDLPTASGRPARRYLAGHRLDIRPWQFLELAATEVIVFGGVDRPLEWYYLNPLVPYYWEQINEDKDDNPLWNLEWSARLARGWEFYGEWLIDDFQIDLKSEPQQLGILVGLHAAAPFGLARSYHVLEYSYVNTTVYGQNEEQNRYYYRYNRAGQVIGLGSRYGPDADRLTYRVVYHLSGLLDTFASVERRRKGEHTIDDPQSSMVPHGVPFPSGIVDRRWELTGGLKFQYHHVLFAEITGGWSQRRNEDHRTGNNHDVFIAEGSLHVDLWHAFRFAP